MRCITEQRKLAEMRSLRQKVVSYIVVVCICNLLLVTVNQLQTRNSYGESGKENGLLNKNTEEYYLPSNLIAERTYQGNDLEVKSSAVSVDHHDNAESFPETIEQFQAKVSKYRDATRVVYNRVPKCGSTAVHVTMGKLNKALNYTLHIASIFTEHHVSYERQKQIIRKVNSLKEPWIFDRHVFFINFTAHGQDMPVYINTIRDPVDRIASWYYFIRFQHNHIREMPEERRMRTFDDCVQNHFEECVSTSNYSDYYNFMFIPFFCGSDEYCLKQTPRALNQAKINVIKHYAVVGLMEDLPNFFSVLEYVLPQFFKGCLEEYDKSAKSLAQTYRTKKKITPSDKTRQILQDLLPLEYNFYHFVRQRFYNVLNNVEKLRLQEA